MIDKFTRQIAFFVLLCFIGSCASKVASTSKQPSGYSEDITLYRPVYPAPEPDTGNYTISDEEEVKFIEPTESITAGLDSLLDSIASYTRSRGYYQVYTIQIYNGTSNSDANDAKARAYEEFPDYIPDLEYQQPVFRVRLGTFYERFDALKMLEKIRKIFPNAILIPQRVYD